MNSCWNFVKSRRIISVYIPKIDYLCYLSKIMNILIYSQLVNMCQLTRLCSACFTKCAALLFYLTEICAYIMMLKRKDFLVVFTINNKYNFMHGRLLAKFI